MSSAPYLALMAAAHAGVPVILDGGTGTELEARGAPMYEGAWCSMATKLAPAVLEDVHRSYIRAGARVIMTNTFSSNRNMLEPAGIGAHFEQLIDDSVLLARRAREAEESAEQVAIAGSMSHQVPMLGPGQPRPETFPSPPLARARFDEMADRLANAGVDFLVMEMMSNPQLANPAIEAARATGLPVWVGFSVRASEAGTLTSNSRRALDVKQMFNDINLEGVEVAGVMHSNITECTEGLRELREVWSGPLMCYPDSGYFKMPHWQFEDVIAPEAFAAAAIDWFNNGVAVLGGCCGLGVNHIETLARALGPAIREVQ
jgi:S-methylmethionine-dependent homocysteine/selenocysteine methylase